LTRVLHVISGMDHRQGGPAYALSGLAQYQRRAGLDVTCFVGWRPGDTTDLIDAMAAEGVRVVRCGPCTGPLARCGTMRKQMEEAVKEADICHIHAVWMQIQHEAARACRQANVPYIFRSCGMLDPWCLAQSRLKKKLYMAWRLRKDLDGAAAMHFTSETEEKLVEPLGLRPPAIVEPNGVDLAEFAQMPAKGLFRNAFPVCGDRPIVLFLSRVHRKKGLDLLIPAFAEARINDWMLVIAGPDDRDYMAEVTRMIAAHQMEDHVVMTGILRGQARLEAFADASLFCLPSYQENFGVAVVEALAAGLPVIISDQVNIHGEITRGGVGGVVPCDVNALAAELGRWMSDADFRHRAADAARSFVRETWDWKTIAERWSHRYARLLAKA